MLIFKQSKKFFTLTMISRIGKMHTVNKNTLVQAHPKLNDFYMYIKFEQDI